MFIVCALDVLSGTHTGADVCQSVGLSVSVATALKTLLSRFALLVHHLTILNTGGFWFLPVGRSKR